MQAEPPAESTESATEPPTQSLTRTVTKAAARAAAKAAAKAADGTLERAADPAPVQTSKFQGRQDQLLDAAARLFNLHGIKGTTLADVAATVGLTGTSITYYYRRKEDLAVACFMRMLDGLSVRIAEAERETTLEKRMRSLFFGELEMFARIERGEQGDVISYNDFRSLPPQHSETIFQRFNESWKRLRNLISAPGLEHVRHDELNARTYLIVSQLMRVRRCIVDHEPDTYAWVAEQLVNILLNGFAQSSAQWVPNRAASTWNLLSGTDPQQEAFLRTATKLINDLGYRGASISRIVSQMNLTKGAFYHHLQNKDELVTLCFGRSFAAQRRAQSMALERGTNGWQRIFDSIHALACLQLSDEGPLLRGRALAALPDPVQQAYVQSEHGHVVRRWSNLIVDGMVDGSLRVVDPTTGAHVLSNATDNAGGLTRWVHGASQANAADLWLRPLLLGLLRS
jgi:AcrR family transcriptional regulator